LSPELAKLVLEVVKIGFLVVGQFEVDDKVPS
jgi:hypothetical protein